MHIYENDHLRIETQRRSEIENSIKEKFNGQLHFRSLNTVLKPQCNVGCGGYLKRYPRGQMGTVGVFGEIKNALPCDSIQTVALSAPHVISSGDIACSSKGWRFGECIWPESSESIHDVSIVKIDPSVITSLKRTYFDEQIKIEEIPKENLLYRKVFKYGATSQETSGSIEQLDDFQLFDNDVIVISSDDPKRSFSTYGDSGAIVLTIHNEKHHGIGVIYGKVVDEDKSIAIFLKNALDEFTRNKHMTIEFDKI